jgi:MoaA/NifB/PqqE/SkfB family radical SAM enzyme/ribosomal protein L7/L12
MLAALGMRRFDLDGAELFFERATGLSIRHEGPETRGRRLRAPRLVQFAITNACNLACGFCSRDLEAKSAWTSDEAFRVLADLAAAGTLEVAFGGGEPLAFRGFDALVERLHTETPLAVGITTNGLLLTEERLRRLAPHVSQVRVSVYDDNAWRDTLGRLAQQGVAFGVNLLVTRDVLRTLEERVREMVALGTRDVLLLGYVGADPAMLLTRDEEETLAGVVRGLTETLRGRADLKLGVCWGDRLGGVPRLSTSGTSAIGDCGAGRDFVVIGSDRTLSPCSFHDVRVPITSAADVLEAWERHRVALGSAATRPGCARGPALVQLRTPRRSMPAPAADTFHVYAAWASNNSGSYTLVGSFGDRDVARAAGERLATLFRDMHAFYTEREAEVRRLIAAGEKRIVLPEVETPAHRLVAAEGLTPLPADFEDADSWPSDGGSAEGNVLVTGQQVIVHVGWTVTMPRALAELFFKAGARIDLELVHSHHPLVAVATLHLTAGGQSAEAREARRAALASLRAELDTLLLAPRPPRWVGDDEPRTPHAWRASDYVLELGLVPQDPVPELAAVRTIAERHGAEMHVRFFEALSEGGDPLADMRVRSDERAAGAWSVILWREGPDRVAVMKVIREHTALGLEEAKRRLADLPVALAEGVTERDATAFAEALALVRADATADPRRSA